MDREEVRKTIGLKNNPRYENNIYVYMMTEPIRRLRHSDELETFSDDELRRYFKGHL